MIWVGIFSLTMIAQFWSYAVAASILLVHLGLYRVVASRMAATAGRPAQEPIKSGNGFSLVLKSPYLRLVALFLVLPT